MNGKIVLETVGSLVLKNNPLGDPRRREIPVYVPPQYFEDTERRFPIVYFLPGFTGTTEGVLHPHPWKEGLFERVDRLVSSGEIAPCLLAVPDCFTFYGGSQYMDSPAVGKYEEHLVGELVPYLDSKYRVAAGPEGHAVMGKSSGGYGALRLAMRHPEVFGHLVSHSGDMFFEACYGPDMFKCVGALAKYGGSFRKFHEAFRLTRDKNDLPHELINMMAMAACYSPNPKSPTGFDIPFDEHTGELISKVWRRWQREDPVHMAQGRRSELKRLKTVFFDCGTRDEFYLYLGARKLSLELKRLGVRHTYEEHGLGHFNMNERYDRGLAVLSAAWGQASRKSRRGARAAK